MKPSSYDALHRASPWKILGLVLILAQLLSACQAVRSLFPDQQSAMLPSLQQELSSLQGLPEYTIQVTLDLSRQIYYGSMQLEFTNTELVPFDRLYFRLFPNGGQIYGNGSLMVTAASVNNRPAQTTLSVENTVLELPLPGLLGSGDQAKITLDFAGLVPLDFGGADGDAYGIYNQSGTLMLLMGWYPQLSVYDQDGWNLDPLYPIGDAVYSDVALYTVDVTVPNDVVVVATGASVSVSARQGSMRYRYVSGPVRDFALAASPDFLLLQQSVGEILVSSYYLSGQEAGAQRALELAAGSLALFNERFSPYPYTELDVVAAPMRRIPGMEMPGMIVLDSDEYAGYATTAFRDLVAHEVSHQWWYSLVGNDVIEEPWLDEALATYSGALYAELALSQDAYQEIMAFRRGRYTQMVNEGWDAPVSADLAYFVRRGDLDSYSPVVYSKGAVFLEALRLEIGDVAFFTALQAYAALYRYKIAAAGDLMAVFETTAGRDLDAFSQPWLSAQP